MNPVAGDLVKAGAMSIACRLIARRPLPLAVRVEEARQALVSAFPTAHHNSINALLELAVKACDAAKAYRPSEPQRRPSAASVPSARRIIRDADRRRRKADPEPS